MILEIKNLEAWYGKMQILHGVNVNVKEGDVVSIIGPNGAGKSTVLKSIFGLTTRKGEIIFDGKDIIKMNPENIASLGISYVPQGRSVFSSLTVEENLELGVYIKKVNVEEKLEEIYERFPRLKERRKVKTGLLSGGEQQMVAIGRSLISYPRLILLDEPSLGLSPKIKRMIFDKVKDIRELGITILVVEQNARMALEVSERAYVLEAGKNRLDGRGKELLKDKRVQHLYLGGVV